MPRVLDDILRRLRLYEPLVDAKHNLQRLTPGYRRAESELVSLYRMFVTSGDLVFDVGANVGEHTRLLASLGARVIAVEPQPSCLKVLHRSFDDHPMVTIVASAAGATPGEAEMHISTARPLSSMSVDWIEAVKRSGRFGSQSWIDRLPVAVTTLDDLIHQYGHPSFVKIDVEGYELQVLQGLHRRIQACSIEYTPERIGVTRECVTYLRNLGMAYFAYSTSASPRLCSEWMTAPNFDTRLRCIGENERSGNVYAALEPPHGWPRT